METESLMSRDGLHCCDDINACMVVRNSIYGGVELPYVCYCILYIAFNLCSSYSLCLLLEFHFLYGL